MVFSPARNGVDRVWHCPEMVREHNGEWQARIAAEKEWERCLETSRHRH